jgi:hypothetical protein
MEGTKKPIRTRRTRWKPNWRGPSVEMVISKMRYGLTSCKHCLRPCPAMAKTTNDLRRDTQYRYMVREYRSEEREDTRKAERLSWEADQLRRRTGYARNYLRKLGM